MYLPTDDSELTKIIWWTNPPKDRYRGRAKAEWLFEQLETLPSLKGICVPEKDREIFEFALDLQATGKTGLYIGFLLVLAFRGDPTACLRVAGALAQRMADGHSQNPLLSRIRLVHMPPPPPTAADRVIDTILGDLGRRQGLTADDAPGLEPEVRKALVSSVRKGMSPRRLNTVLEEIFAIEIRGRLVS
jgi:hypothetical protein